MWNNYRKKSVALLLTALMILASFSSVFAAEEIAADAPAQDAVTTETPADETAAPVGSDGAAAEEAAPAEEEPDPNAPPEAVEELTAYPGYQSITLRWKKVEGAYAYKIVRKDGKGKFKTVKKALKPTKKYTLASDKDYMNYRDKKAKEKNVTYTYKVYALKKVDGEVLKSKAATAKEKAVRQMYQKITFSSGVTLYPHGGKRIGATHFNAGQTVTAEGFGGGKFKFYYKGALFFANYARMTNCKADYIENESGAVKKYSKKWDKGTQYYDKVTAENFVNESKVDSSTKYLIWVSTYTQHLYIFKGKKGHWKLAKDWEVSTGKAASPTPTGFYKRIHTKTYSYSNNIKYWLMFQSYNSIHGKRPEYKIGEPASHGCVRNFDENALWMWDHIGRGTRVMIY